MGLLQTKGVSAFSVKANYLKILAYAPSGNGKTSLIGTMPGKVAVLAGEKQGGLSIARTARDLKRPESDITIFHLEDQIDPRTGKVTQYAGEYAKALITDLEKGDHDFDALALDSLTDIQSTIVSGMKKKKGGLDKTLSQQEWGVVIDETRDLCKRLRDLPMHVLLVALAMHLQDDAQKSLWRPSLFGKKLPEDLPQYFNLVVFPKRDRVRGEGMRARYYVVTEGGDEAYTKGHPALGSEEEPNITKWVEKINAYGLEAGEGAISVKVEHKVKADAPPDPIQVLIADEEVKGLFDQLSAPEAKRVATAKKYNGDRAKLIEILVTAVEDHNKAAAKQAERDAKSGTVEPPVAALETPVVATLTQ